MGAVSKFFATPVVQTGAVYAFAGIGFSGANLIFAWALPPQEYGLLALLIALVNVGMGVGPLGLNGVVNRHLIRADLRLFAFGVMASVICATALSGFGYLTYGVSALSLAVMSLAVIAGAVTQLAAARFQVMHRFLLATSLSQLANLGLALTSVVVLFSGLADPLLPLFLMAVTMIATAVWSWTVLLQQVDYGSRRIQRTDWHDAMLIAGLTVASHVGVQLERMVIPKLFSLETLATYAVLAAIALAPYRSLELATAYTLLPRLRAQPDPKRRRRLLEKEVAFITLLCVGGGLAIWIVAPVLIELIYAEKFQISRALITAAIVGGTVKVGATLTRTAAIAYCTTTQLGTLNWLGWGTLALSLIAAVMGTRWGLTGAIYGVSLGFLVRAVATLHLAIPFYEVPPAGPTSTDG